MPELPEVETTLKGISPYLSGATISRLMVRERRLRWPVPNDLESKVAGQQIRFLERRGKYILIGLQKGGLLIHLGMSGSVRVLLRPEEPLVHDHFDLETTQGDIIRYRDPRRFGCLLWHPKDVYQHQRLQNLGVEPLTTEFNSRVLIEAAKGRRTTIKNLIMDGKIVVGVGNIYAAESLFDAGINPLRSCQRVADTRYQHLVQSIQTILSNAVLQGGTTLKDFTGVDGRPGYFKQKLLVYGRAGEACYRCDGVIRKKVSGQRATYYCPSCQR